VAAAPGRHRRTQAAAEAAACGGEPVKEAARAEESQKEAARMEESPRGGAGQGRSWVPGRVAAGLV
jgi:hypothetical protein